jgi:hypothetical protein
MKQNFKTDLTEISYKMWNGSGQGPRAMDLGTMVWGDLDAQGNQFSADPTHFNLQASKNLRVNVIIASYF